MDKRNNKRHSISQRLSLFMAAMMLVMALVVSVISFVALEGTYLRLYNEKAQDVVRTLAAKVDGDRIAGYVETGEKDDYYAWMKEEFDLVKSEFTGIQYLYLFQPREDHFIYVVEGNKAEDDPDLKRAVTVEDGEFAAWYSIFDKQIVNEGYFIRKDLLDKLGMGIPESVNQLNDFAYAAKSEFGLQSVMMMASDLAVMSEAFGLGSASAAGTGTTVATGAGFSYHREGDQIVADITSERYQTYVEQLHQWYADGIVSQNFTELDSGNFSGDMEAELAADRTVICKTLVNSWDNLITLNPDPDFELAPMVVTLDGGNVHSGRGERQFDSSSFSSTCDPELYPYILGWMNYWYTEEGAMLGNYGIQGVDYDYDENGNIYYLEGITQNEYGYPPMLFSRARCFSGAAFGLMYQDRTVPFFVEAQNECIDLWTSRTDDEEAVPQSLSLTTEESEIVAQYGPDLATFISEEIPKFVTGARDLATWGDFMATVEDMHVAELTEVYQAAYDRYFEN